MRPATIAALLVGVLITGEGILGLVLPESFEAMVRFFQAAPMIHAAALIRIACGVALVLAARGSRLPGAIGALGVVIALGGVASLFLGEQMARPILESWAAGGAVVVRAWAAVALALGVFLLAALSPPWRTG